jgi:hypothetical protein
MLVPFAHKMHKGKVMKVSMTTLNFYVGYWSISRTVGFEAKSQKVV